MKLIFKTTPLLGLLAIANSCGNRPMDTAIEFSSIIHLDSTVNPGDDFYGFVNNKWLNEVEIPSDQAKWGSFDEIGSNTFDELKDIIESALESGMFSKNSPEWKVIQFYKTGLDSVAIERSQNDFINSLFKPIISLTSKKDLPKYLAMSQRLLTTVPFRYPNSMFFQFKISRDLKQSRKMAAYLEQGGVGLYDARLYLNDDAKSIAVRNQYKILIDKVFEVIGTRVVSEKILNLEARLAKGFMAPEELRNTERLYNKYSVKELSTLTPSFNWAEYYAALNLTLDSVIVKQPSFFMTFETILEDFTIDDIQLYLKWCVIRDKLPYLGKELSEADFRFYGTVLTGAQKNQPRWKRVILAADNSLGDAMGKLYISKSFSPLAKDKVLEITEQVRLAYISRIKKLDWLSDSTRLQALKKLEHLGTKIGFPDRWDDYAKLTIGESSFLDNILSAESYKFDLALAKLNKPADNSEWVTRPYVPNAYYRPTFNEIVFPAGILKPPFYYHNAEDAINYGAIGSLIGHEMSHAFDDQGSRFDWRGNLQNWWTLEDHQHFQTKKQKLINQFNAYKVLDSVSINGELTIGENIADLSGLTASLEAFQNIAANLPSQTPNQPTPLQKFFISFANSWRHKYRDEYLYKMVKTDSHSPAKFRVLGPLSNIEVFYQVFEISPSNKIWRPVDDRLKLW